MGGSCGTYSGEERCIQDFGRETNRKDNVEDVGVHGEIILKGS
jgi:hypothetical protein